METRPVLKALIEAREKLAELRTACRLIPHPDIITATIPLREARASTVIENIVTTNDELFRAQWQVDNEPSAAQEMATLTLTQPYLRISNVLSAGLAQRQTASKWLNHLVKLGLLEETKLGREKIFINRNALEILTLD